MSDQEKAEVIQRGARLAIQVQDACNLVAVLGSFHNVTLQFMKAGMGTDEIRNHPVVQLWADKIADLTGRGNNFFEIYDKVEALTK